MRRYEQLSLLLGDLIATHHTNYNGDGKPGFGITHQIQRQPTQQEYLGWLLITQISPWAFFLSGWAGIILGIYGAKREGRLNVYFFLAILLGWSNLVFWVVGQAIVLFK
ncbi:MAG: hypothetical protein HC789_20520 [Microcoleus sp. CSU_2_2]|nr:hypothetical protein [Microcoleus sp. CSU_2_2]